MLLKVDPSTRGRRGAALSELQASEANARASWCSSTATTSASTTRIRRAAQISYDIGFTRAARPSAGLPRGMTLAATSTTR